MGDAMVRCWRCKHEVPVDMTTCMAGVGTQCVDSKACRERSRVAPQPPPTLEERLWVVERRRTRPDGTLGEWRTEYYHRGPTAPDDPSTEYFERRVVEYVPREEKSDG